MDPEETTTAEPETEPIRARARTATRGARGLRFSTENRAQEMAQAAVGVRTKRDNHCRGSAIRVRLEARKEADGLEAIRGE